jgi:5-methylcytosine-specific restriction protein A
MTKPIDRIRGRALQKIRANHFTIEPLCVVCKAAGRVSVATELDHVVALTNGGDDFDRRYQVQPNGSGLCVDCHARKTAQDLNRTHRPRVSIGLDGWPR